LDFGVDGAAVFSLICRYRSDAAAGALSIDGNGAQGRDRTTDTVIFSHVLYQLSYLGAEARRTGGPSRARAL
jgi:hypothetical protein